MNEYVKKSDVLEIIKTMPSDMIEEYIYDLKGLWIDDAEQTEPQRGKWEEKEAFHNADNADDNPIIEEWQSARCSVCNKYHTTPYMYYFNDYNFCPNCGADMREREGE